jgi:glycosyltransferase involved in cell wall biosynthesis
MVSAGGAGGIAHVARCCAGELRRQGATVREVRVPAAGVPAVAAGRRVWRLRREIRSAGTVHIELGLLSVRPFWFAVWAGLLRGDLVLAAHDLPRLVKHPGAGVLRTAPGRRDVVAYRLAAPLLDPLLTSWVRRRTGCVVVLSEAAGRGARAQGFRRVVVTDHGADPPVGGPPPSRGRHVLFAGFLTPAKGLDVLCDAWQRVAGQAGRAGLPLVIAGDAAPDRAGWLAGLRERFAATAAPPCWQTGVTDERFQRLIADAAVVVLPYLASNPASGVLIRAVAQGRPVVASTTPAFRAVLTDGESGLLVPPGDAAALAAALRSVLTDPALRDRLGGRAGELARHRFSWRGHVAGLLAGYTAATPGSSAM